MRLSEIKESDEQLDEFLPAIGAAVGGIARVAAAVGSTALKGAQALGGAVAKGAQALGGAAVKGAQAAGLAGGAMDPAQAAGAVSGGQRDASLVDPRVAHGQQKDG
jgi:hypothetical protein